MINYHTYHNSQLSILNSQLNKLQFTSCRGKPRRLWRLAVAPQPPIAERQSAPCPEGTRIHQKPTASSEGAQLWDKHHLTLSWFRKAGPTIILLNIIRDASVPLRGTIFRWRCRTYPQLRCFAACSGFHDIGPAPRNLQLKLNLLVVRGCVALPCKYRTKSKKLLQNKN